MAILQTPLDLIPQATLLAGKAKGMEPVLLERGLLEELKAKSLNGKPVRVCSKCKMFQVAQGKAVKAVKPLEEEIEGVGVEGITDHYECVAEVEDLECLDNCCMQCILTLQSDFADKSLYSYLLLRRQGTSA